MKDLFRILFAILLIQLSLDVSACTIFTASSSNNVFAGNNEDMCTTNTEIHLFPETEDKYGRVFWGFIGDGNFQGGMNEHGLFFDGAGLPFNEMPPSELPEYQGRWIMESMLEKCRTVEGAISLLKKYSMPSLQYAHDLIADATGDAVIVEWGNNEVNFIRKGNKNYLIATNFNISESENIRKECGRYNIVEDILSNEAPSLASFEKALSLSHQEGNYGTMYSQIGDLKRKKLYVYNFHDYTNRYEIDLANDLSSGEARYTIRDLFPESVAESNFRMRVDCIAEMNEVQDQKVTFQIVSEDAIPGTNISIRGSSAELGRWNEEGVTYIFDHLHNSSKTVEIKKGTMFDFSLYADNRKYLAVDRDSGTLKGKVVEVMSDTTMTFNITDWKLIP